MSPKKQPKPQPKPKQPVKPRQALGVVRPLTDAEIAKLAEVTEQDIQDALNAAVPELRALLEAKAVKKPDAKPAAD